MLQAIHAVSTTTAISMSPFEVAADLPVLVVGLGRYTERASFRFIADDIAPKDKDEADDEDEDDEGKDDEGEEGEDDEDKDDADEDDEDDEDKDDEDKDDEDKDDEDKDDEDKDDDREGSDEDEPKKPRKPADRPRRST